MALARAHLESLLRARQLDRTLTTAIPQADPRDEHALAPSGISALDARLGGGFPRGQLSELVGPRSSGRTSLLLQMLAAATARGELVALVDALDMLDVESAAAAGVDLDRVLWIRGHVVTSQGLARELNQRAIEQAIRAFTLVLQAGNFGLVVFDVAEAPADHDLAAAAADGGRQSDGMSAGWRRAHGQELRWAHLTARARGSGLGA